MQKAISLLETKSIEITVGKSFPLKKAANAHEYIEARKAVGKIVLIPDN
jgi:NADPH:quinone reductase-like Zn-dependent oxidoreductase